MDIEKEITKWPTQIQDLYWSEKILKDSFLFNFYIGTNVKYRSNFKEINNPSPEDRRTIKANLSKNYYRTFPKILSQQNATLTE